MHFKFLFEYWLLVILTFSLASEEIIVLQVFEQLQKNVRIRM
jgi:hypothetical protein